MTTSTPPPLTDDAARFAVRVRDVSKVFNAGGRNPVHALRDVDLDVRRGEYLAVMGPSGSGKSTLFNIIGALDRATTGEVLIDGLTLSALRPREVAYLRCHRIGYVFQSYNLLPAFTALRNVALPAIFMGLPLKDAEAKAAARLTQLGLGHRLKHRPDELSGGQQQRVAIARALVNDPLLLLADEPTANLDLHTGGQVIEVFKNLTRQQGVTIISTTHDHKMLANADRVCWVKDGRIDKVKTADEINVQQGTIHVSQGET